MASRGLRADVSKSIGDLLLRGHAMMAENCPTCPVPLMKDPRTGDRLCVNCETVYRAGAPLLQPSAPGNTASTSQATLDPSFLPQQQPQQPLANGSHALGSEDESSDFGDDPGPQADEGGLANGPLDPREDPSVFGPFARGTSAAAAGPSTGRPATDAGGAQGVPASAPPIPQGGHQQSGAEQPGAGVPGLRRVDPEIAAARERERQRSDHNAELIGQRLLQGWALLDAACPRCDTPLVRQRTTRRMFCVDCDMWVMTQEEAAAAAAAASAPAPATPPPTSPSGPASSSSGTGGAPAAIPGRGTVTGAGTVGNTAAGTSTSAAGAGAEVVQQGAPQRGGASAVSTVQALLLSQRQGTMPTQVMGLPGAQPAGLAAQHPLASSAAVDEGLLESVVVHSLERTLLNKLSEAEAALAACPLIATPTTVSPAHGVQQQQAGIRSGMVWEAGVQGSLQVMQVIKESIGLLKMLKELRGPTRSQSSSGA